MRETIATDSNHGNRGGGPLHNVATADFAGFMSSADKVAFDLYQSVPVTKTADFTVAATEGWLICNGAASITVTLPSPAASAGRVIELNTIAAFTVVSVASDVVPITGGAAGTAILPATAGAWATLKSDGTNWIIMKKG